MQNPHKIRVIAFVFDGNSICHAETDFLTVSAHTASLNALFSLIYQGK